MTTIRIPTPLRPYVGGESTIPVEGDSVAAVLANLTEQYTELRNHLFDGDNLRSFVNVYLNQEDIRHLNGLETAVGENDKLMIVPSIAGGSGERRIVDHSALRTNQAFIMGLLLVAFVANWWWLAAFVGAVMLLGTAVPRLALFKQAYVKLLKPVGLVKPDIIADNPEPHRFAQGFGGMVVALAVTALLTGAAGLGWGLVWLVVVLAAANFFLGFCAGCFVYYQLNKLGVPGFQVAPLQK